MLLFLRELSLIIYYMIPQNTEVVWDPLRGTPCGMGRRGGRGRCRFSARSTCQRPTQWDSPLACSTSEGRRPADARLLLVELGVGLLSV